MASDLGPILINYSQKDDQPLQHMDRGWVSFFHRFLRTFLEQLLDKEVEIQLLNQQNQQDVKKASLFISILSPDYNKQENFKQYLNDFYLHHKRIQSEEEALNRIFKVFKRPVDFQHPQDKLVKALGYDFYTVDPVNSEVLEMNNFFGPRADRIFWARLVDLAYDMARILEGHGDKIHQKKSKSGSAKQKKTVYLAHTGVDLIVQRDMVKRELQRHGIRVLPNQNFPNDEQEMLEIIKRDLSRSDYSIHLIGEDYGEVLEGLGKSVVDLQNQLSNQWADEIGQAGKESKELEKQKFNRLIWLSPELKNVSERQRIFIEELKNEASAFSEAELIQIDFQEFKNLLVKELVEDKIGVKGQFIAEDDLESSNSKSSIYLIIDQEDSHETKQLEQLLESNGFRVLKSSFEGNLIDLRYLHQQNLRTCDASLIYYKNGNEEWIRTKLQDLLKAPGFGRVKPLKAKAIYMDREDNKNRSYFEKNEAIILEGKNSDLQEKIQPFLSKLTSNGSSKA